MWNASFYEMPLKHYCKWRLWSGERNRSYWSCIFGQGRSRQNYCGPLKYLRRVCWSELVLVTKHTKGSLDRKDVY